MTVRDRLWLFASRAHDDDIWLGKGRANRFSCWSRITPAEGAAMLDIPNVVMIVSDGIPVPYSADAYGYMESFCRMKNVVWSITGSSGFRAGNEENFICHLAEKYPNVTVTAEFTGSSAGIESVLAGSVDIGNSSRNLKDDEKSAGAAENIVAIDGIAVVADPANKVEDLTKDQLVSIYTGETKNWSEVGGDDQAIVVVGREAGSGTRGAFEELLDIADACVYANELDSTGAVMAKVASTPGAIGYVSLDVVDDSVKALKLDGVDATEENIKAGNYALSRPFVMATKGEISEQKTEVQALFDYLSSDEGKALIKSVGLITVD